MSTYKVKFGLGDVSPILEKRYLEVKDTFLETRLGFGLTYVKNRVSTFSKIRLCSMVFDLIPALTHAIYISPLH